MRPKRNDIRVSRKFGPSNKVLTHSNTNGRRSSRLNNEAKTDVKSTRLSNSRLRSQRVAKVTKGVQPKRVVSLNSKVNQNHEKFPTVKEAKINNLEPSTASKMVEQRRRRTGAETYINKRFLYDVVEPPKRTRQKKFMHFSDRSAAALMAVSSANILKRHKQKRHNVKPAPPDEDYASLRSRHGRRLKPKLEYSPSHDVSDGFSNEGIAVTEGDFRKPHRKIRSLGKASKYKLDADINDPEWIKTDLYGDDFVSTDDHFTMLDDVKDMNTLKNKSSLSSDLSHYSEVLLGQLRSSPPRIIPPNDPSNETGIHQDVRRRNHSRFKIRPTFRHNSNTSNNLKDPADEYMRRSVYPPDRISLGDDAHTTDLLGFCSTSRRHDQFSHPESPEDITEHEDDLDPAEARTLTSRRLQPSHEDLEEDLLAPQLSILSGQSAGTDADTVLVPGMTDANGSVLATTSVSGSSRRKSPVRPMQVLRTKASTHASSLVPTNTQSNMLVSGSENGQYIITPSVIPNNVYNRPTSEADLAHKENILSTNMCAMGVGSDKKSADNFTKESPLNLHSTSVVRVSNLAPDLNHITIHSVNDLPITSNVSPIAGINTLNSGSHCVDSPNPFNGGGISVSSSLLPSLLSQSTTRSIQQTVLPRVFVTTSVVRTPTTAQSNKTVTSVTHSTTHSSTSNRRRPTILKRGMGSTTSSTGVTPLGNQRQPDPEVSPHHPPVSRTIGLFTASSGQVHKTSNSATDSTNNPTPAPTKLLQLVTASSLPNTQSRTNQTASDRLFGRRPVAHTKPTATPGLTTSTTTTSNIQRALTGEIRPSPPSINSMNSTTPYRYAVVRGSADGKQYVLISNPRIIDNSVQESTPLTASILSGPNESAFVTTTVSDDTYVNDQVYPVDRCIPGTFKVEINGAHLLQSSSGNGHHHDDSNGRLNSIFVTSNPGTTTMAAT